MKKPKERSLKVRKLEENVVDLNTEKVPVIPMEYKLVPGRTNQLWRWDTLEDVVFK